MQWNLEVNSDGLITTSSVKLKSHFQKTIS